MNYKICSIMENYKSSHFNPRTIDVNIILNSNAILRAGLLQFTMHIYFTIMKYVCVYLCCTVYHKHFRFDNRKRWLVDCALSRLSGIRREYDFANFAAKQTRLRAFYDTALGLSSVYNSICPRAITAVEIHTGWPWFV